MTSNFISAAIATAALTGSLGPREPAPSAALPAAEDLVELDIEAPQPLAHTPSTTEIELHIAEGLACHGLNPQLAVTRGGQPAYYDPETGLLYDLSFLKATSFPEDSLLHPFGAEQLRYGNKEQLIEILQSGAVQQLTEQEQTALFLGEALGIPCGISRSKELFIGLRHGSNHTLSSELTDAISEMYRSREALSDSRFRTAALIELAIQNDAEHNPVIPPEDIANAHLVMDLGGTSLSTFLLCQIDTIGEREEITLPPLSQENYLGPQREELTLALRVLRDAERCFDSGTEALSTLPNSRTYHLREKALKRTLAGDLAVVLGCLQGDGHVTEQGYLSLESQLRPR